MEIVSIWKGYGISEKRSGLSEEKDAVSAKKDMEPREKRCLSNEEMLCYTRSEERMLLQ
jgi:hypothetical protein